MGCLIAYIGPETIMPIASAIAAVVGAFLFMGRSVLGFFQGLFGRVLGKRDDDAPAGGS